MQVAKRRGQRDDSIGLDAQRDQRRQMAEPGANAPYLSARVMHAKNRKIIGKERWRGGSCNHLIVVQIQELESRQAPDVIVHIAQLVVVDVKRAKAAPGEPAHRVKWDMFVFVVLFLFGQEEEKRQGACPLTRRWEQTRRN